MTTPTRKARKEDEKTMPQILSSLGQQIEHWIEGRKWAANEAPELAEKARGLPDWKIDVLSSEHTEGTLDEKMDTRVQACAYHYGLTTGAVRAVLRVLLRDTLIAAQGRTPPMPKDQTDEEPAPTGEPGWRKALGRNGEEPPAAERRSREHTGGTKRTTGK